ncbi:MAG TPA: prephenate dehydrogenase/arogenate dehydrogenase family protein [Vicinamibacteria bacterium]|nr:prephenate dehydrogenase/arogenate dehydrogenase family protein [Vicinamibacteria bacterium]
MVAGLGLIGGSLARVLTRGGYRVIGLDRPAVLRRARRSRAIASAAASLGEALAGADVLVLAAPPRVNLALLREAARLAPPGLVVTDVGSVKQRICAEAARLGLRDFVGGHPLAGTERSGFEASSARLFEGRSWVLTPLPGGERAARVVASLARSAGARAVRLAPAEHDRAVALLSHVPQLVSWALLDAVRADPMGARHLRIAGPGFRDMTRLARSPRGLWRQILTENRAEVRRALAAFRRALRRRP